MDNLIEKNEEIIQRLQHEALLKFRKIFAKQSFCPLGNYAYIIMGQSPSGESYNENGEGVIFFQGRTDFGFRFPTTRLYTTEPKRLAHKGDILLSVRAPVGDLNIAESSCCIGRGLATISSELKDYIFYALLFAKKEFDIYNSSGTIFGSINREQLSSFKIPFKTEADIIYFNNYAKDINQLIFAKHVANKKLKQIKQKLLQKYFG